MKKLMMTLMTVMIAIAANAQYNTNYYNQYGNKRHALTMVVVQLPTTTTNMAAA